MDALEKRHLQMHQAGQAYRPVHYFPDWKVDLGLFREERRGWALCGSIGPGCRELCPRVRTGPRGTSRCRIPCRRSGPRRPVAPRQDGRGAAIVADLALSVSSRINGLPSPSQTACSLEFSPPLVGPMRRGTALFAQARGQAASVMHGVPQSSGGSVVYGYTPNLLRRVRSTVGGSRPMQPGEAYAMVRTSVCRTRSSVGTSISNRDFWGSPMLIAFHVLIQAGLIVRVLLRPHRDPASRVAWIVVILAFPVVGIVAYLLLGETNIGRQRAEPRNAYWPAFPISPARLALTRRR